MRARDLERLANLEQKLACEDALYEEEYTRLAKTGSRIRSVELRLIEYRQEVLRKKIKNLKEILLTQTVKRDKYADELTRRERMLEISNDNLARLYEEAKRLLVFDFSEARATEISDSIGKEKIRNATAKRSLDYWISKKADIKDKPTSLGIDAFDKPKVEVKKKFTIDIEGINDTMTMEEKTAKALEETFGSKLASVTKEDYNTDVSAIFEGFDFNQLGKE